VRRRRPDSNMRGNCALAICGIALALAPSFASAQGPTDNIDTILQRLEAAESRIRQLESEKPSSTIDTPTNAYEQAVAGSDDKLTDRLEDIENNYRDLSRDYQSLSNDYRALDNDWTKFHDAEKKQQEDAAKKPSFQIGGRIHLDLWSYPSADPGIGFFEHPNPANANFGTDPEDFVGFRRIRLETKGDVMDWGLWRIQIDFNNPSSAEMKDVYIGFKNLPHNQQLLIGNQKRPLGLDHLNSSRFNVFLERPFVVESFNPDARRPGIAMYGYSDDELYHWRYGAYYLENISRDGRYLGDSRQMSLNARLSSSPWYDESSGGRGYYHWAIAGMAAHPDGDANATDGHRNEGRFATRPEARTQSPWLDTGRIAGADWYYIVASESILNVGPFQYTSELQYNQLLRDNGMSNLNFYGGYAYVSYFLTGEHIPYDRRTGTIGRVKPFENFFLVDRCDGCTGHGWGAWAVAARYSYMDLTDREVLGGVGESVTLALNWHWTAYSKVQMNLIRGSIKEHAPVGGFASGNYTIFGVRFAVDF
jgi:phosphate-selective porin OprO/OprP